MPNGGSDCCGTCWFNAQNRGEAGSRNNNRTIPAHCTIRDLPIVGPFYTYCANHPHRRPDRDPIPIGPVYKGNSTGHRELWKPSPDSEEIRNHLLELVAAIQEQPVSEYPMGRHLDEAVVWQLGEFCEARAIDDLQRIASFDPSATNKSDPFARNRARLVALAREALSKIRVSGV